MSKSTLFLLDGMALAYRSHFAFISSNLRNSEGIPTGPILGFANTLEKLIADHQPTHIAVAWDTHAPTFRHEMDDEYKANRPPQPDELKTGIPLIKEMLEGYGIKSIEQDGYEADDIIGTIASQANVEDVDVFLVTPDKDFMQLVHDHIKMYKPDNRNGGFDLIDREGVKNYFGVYPEKVIDVLAILGDTSDNIPGVKGIGKKGAPKLINKYKSLEAAIEDAPNMKSKRHREGLQEYAEQALHAKEMVTIKIDVPNTVHWKNLDWDGAVNKEKLGAFFKRMEFRTLTRKYLDESEVSTNRSSTQKKEAQTDLFDSDEKSVTVKEALKSYDENTVTYTFIDNVPELRKVVHTLKGCEELSFDTETDSVDPMNNNLVGISLSAEEGKAYYIAVHAERGIPEKEAVDILQPLFKDQQSVKIAHNYKFDYLMLSRAGLEIKGPVFCTMIAGYLMDANQKLKMDALAKKYLGYECIPITKLIGKGRKQKSMDELEPEKITVYACEDADITLRLYKKLKELLKRDELRDIAEKLEFPLITVLAKMEGNGVKIDEEMLKEFSTLLGEDLRKLQSAIFELAGLEFNINSPKQLGEVLFDKMGLPAGKKTKTGQYSTAETVLLKLAAEHEVADKILEFRALSKLKSTYVDALPKLIHEETGRVHTDFNQHVAATGRLSSSNPNLQNIPIRTKRGREIRKAFIVEEGYKLLSADYSQVELRVIASIAQDKNMIAAFKNGEDIHARTAKELFNVDSIENVTADQRRQAKGVNFGIPYGVSSYGLSNNLGISRNEGKEMIDQYFERFPAILQYIKETKQFAKENGFVKTLWGRRRYIPQINSRNWNVRSFAERTAINMPIQGTAADIIKQAMINIQKYIEEHKLKTRMLLQVHDELIFEVPEEEANEVPQKLNELMETAADLAVPLKVDMGLATNWLDAH